jgi:type III pantothenate kinase
MNTLLLDVGNSRLKWGLREDAVLHATGHVELRTFIEQGMPALTAQWPNDVDSVVACNVAGDKVADQLSAGIKLQYERELCFVCSEGSAFNVTNSYHEPQRLGVDRWVAMIGARASCDTACVIIDAGTAITIDALDVDGQHLGGQILPGLELMAAALATETSDLPSIGSWFSDANERAGSLANSTATAISNGIIAAAVGAIELVLHALRKDGHDLTILLTGGDAGRINRSLDQAVQLRPDLVLEGLACMTEQKP